MTTVADRRQNQRRLADIRHLSTRGHLLSSTDTTRFVCILMGPEDTPFATKRWRTAIELPKEYPFKAPSVGFLDAIYHPNIDLESGSVCLNALNQEWSPVYQLSSIIETLLPQLLTYPNPDDPLNLDAANVYLDTPEIFREKVEQYIEKHCNKDK